MVAWRALHVFVWTPGMAHARDPVPSFGVTVRYRRDGGWTHLRLVALQRNKPPPQMRRPRPGHVILARPTLTLAELARWRTWPGTRDRLGVKSYLRLKVGPGGREVPC